MASHSDVEELEDTHSDIGIAGKGGGEAGKGGDESYEIEAKQLVDFLISDFQVPAVVGNVVAAFLGGGICCYCNTAHEYYQKCTDCGNCWVKYLCQVCGTGQCASHAVDEDYWICSSCENVFHGACNPCENWVQNRRIGQAEEGGTCEADETRTVDRMETKYCFDCHHELMGEVMMDLAVGSDEEEFEEDYDEDDFYEHDDWI